MTSADVEREYYAAASKKRVVALFARHNVRPEFYRLELDAICLIAEQVRPTGTAPACRDEDDRKYLHCANQGGVDFLVTRDRDLLDLGPMEHALIVTPDELLLRLRDAGEELVE